jgi:hypothetical protein
VELPVLDSEELDCVRELDKGFRIEELRIGSEDSEEEDCAGSGFLVDLVAESPHATQN